jgi:hypothetical protein
MCLARIFSLNIFLPLWNLPIRIFFKINSFSTKEIVLSKEEEEEEEEEEDKTNSGRVQLSDDCLS